MPKGGLAAVKTSESVFVASKKHLDGLSRLFPEEVVEELGQRLG
jgi:hypothetical protein